MDTPNLTNNVGLDQGEGSMSEEQCGWPWTDTVAAPELTRMNRGCEYGEDAQIVL